MHRITRISEPANIAKISKKFNYLLKN